jgi:hypothetical protein
MKTVYRNSYLTIAASRSLDGNGGCFAKTSLLEGFRIHNRSKQFSGISIREPLNHDRFRDRPSRAHESDLEPLASRAWAYQERLLSRRIVHYTGSELVWECESAMLCQYGGIKRYEEESLKLSLSRSLRLNQDSPSLISQWMRIVEEYSGRQLSFETDRLSALSGLAKQFEASQILGTYHAGLWKQNFLDLMIWRTRERSEFPKGKKLCCPQLVMGICGKPDLFSMSSS